MKKLMITAAAVAMTAGAFAVPTVYDYKASVKHMYLKEVPVRIAAIGFNGVVYQKYQKNASLTGYLFLDQDGATSQIIQAQDAATPYAAINAATGPDYGRSRAFLVVFNKSIPNSERAFRHAKVLPAVLDAKWIDTAWARLHTATSGLAEGYLFVGGEMMNTVRMQNDADFVNSDGDITQRAAVNPSIYTYADYAWTSVYLFGQFNGPNWFNRAGANPFNAFEAAHDAALPADLRRTPAATAPYFHDTWMNGAGIGKWAQRRSNGQCCGIITRDVDTTLDTLSGNLKGGLFLCTENGIDAQDANYRFFDDPAGLNPAGWEDQFWSPRVIAGVNDGVVAVATYAADAWCNDVWLDGAIAQETTDVIYGTWSIKRNTKFYNTGDVYARFGAELERAELAALTGAPGATAYATFPAAENAVGLEVLVRSLKAAVLKLDSTATFIGNGEIFSLTSGRRENVTAITPRFARFYGLADWK